MTDSPSDSPPTAALAPEDVIRSLAEQIHSRIKRESERGTEILLSVIESADEHPSIVLAQAYGISELSSLLPPDPREPI